MKRDKWGKIIKEDASTFNKKLNNILRKYKPALMKALKQRREDPEDIYVHDKVESILIAITSEIGIKEAKYTPWMENEMFSGEYTPKQAYDYLVTIIINLHKDGYL